jgi:hypothetical protein
MATKSHGTVIIVAQFAGHCVSCGAGFEAGDSIYWHPVTKAVQCFPCGGALANTVTLLEAKGMPIVLKAPLAPSAAHKYFSKTALTKAPTKAPIPIYRTQKARSVIALQKYDLLASHMARVAQTELEAVTGAHAIGLPCFMRPCPVTPRHGFVDSRVVTSTDDVRAVWQEAIAADPGAEALLMPFVKASHNMVWRPGLVSVGPGHDGATGGHDSATILIEPGYSPHWATIATDATVNLEQCDPFVEAVMGPNGLTVTQVRAGDKGAPAGADWIPAPMIVARVRTIDPATKKDDGAMLAWESEAKALIAGEDLVYNPGGNLGDHWSVHARIHGIGVVTTFRPSVGDTVPAMGQQVEPLDPQAIVWGLLGGLCGPSLIPTDRRVSAVCAAVCGTHHGLRMGGAIGVHLGTSIAVMLRLGQAAIWGEARHAEHHTAIATGKLSRAQIFTKILDQWQDGRDQLKTKADLFWSHAWHGGFGGTAWGTCAKALVALDQAVLDLVRVPSLVHAKRILAAHTTAVNVAHNNGWWLNKFAPSYWFDRAAELDPTVPMMAAPVWYEASTVDPDDRLRLLAAIEDMAPIVLTTTPAKKTKTKIKTTIGTVTAPLIPSPDTVVATGGKLGHWGSAPVGGTIPIPIGIRPLSAQAKVIPGPVWTAHVQVYVTGQGGYYTLDVIGSGPAPIGDGPTMESAAGTGATYQLCLIEPFPGVTTAWAIQLGTTVLAIVAKGNA